MNHGLNLLDHIELFVILASGRLHVVVHLLQRSGGNVLLLLRLLQSVGADLKSFLGVGKCGLGPHVPACQDLSLDSVKEVENLVGLRGVHLRVLGSVVATLDGAKSKTARSTNEIWLIVVLNRENRLAVACERRQNTKLERDIAAK